MQDRIKQLRKALGLTQQEFADRLHIERSTVSNYESGTRSLTNAMIASICREFKVNEQWLRGGVGEMFRTPSRNEEIAAFFGDVLSEKPDSFRRRLVNVLANLSVEQWSMLEKLARDLAKEEETKKEADPED